ncbi:hypothetical protein TNCV_696131 [Trichonephila clavipes]|nr:hypothetical protein TNCV_696131 [Trichonephila clavipes]
MDGKKQTCIFAFSIAGSQTIVLFIQRAYGIFREWEKRMGVIGTFLNRETLDFEAIVAGPHITPETLTSTRIVNAEQ